MEGYLAQFAVSAAAIVVLAAVAWWARIPRPAPRLDEASARSLILDEDPDLTLERVWVDAAGRTAVAKAGDEAVVLFRVGDGFAVRTAPWSRASAAVTATDRTVIRFDDPGAPAAVFAGAGA